MYALVVVAILQPNAPRLFASVTFVGIVLLHEALLSDLDGSQYYGSAALFSLLIIVLTSGIYPIPKMVISLHRLCIVSIFANMFGWAIWYLYYPPLAYDLAFVAIYAWALFILIKRDGADVGGYTLDRWASCFRFNRGSWSGYFNQYGGKI